MNKECQQTTIKSPIWWHHRTALEKTLVTISIGALIGIIILAISLAGVLAKQKDSEIKEKKSTAEALQSPHLNQNEVPESNIEKTGSTCNENVNVCLTPECIHSASDYLYHMDFSVNPCDDFYSFACGGFVKNTVISDEEDAVTVFSVTGDKLHEQLRTMITTDVQPNDSAPFLMVKNLYKACMNTQLIEQRGLAPVFSFMDKFGGWPVLMGNRWDETHQWTWIKAIKKFRRFGFGRDFIFALSIDNDMKNSTIRRIFVDQPGLGLSQAFLRKGLSDKIVKAYYEYMVDIAVIYGADENRAKNELLDSLNFEIALANISMRSEERRNANAVYYPQTIAEAQKKYPYIPWIKYINALLPFGQCIDETEVIVVGAPSFFEKLGSLLEKTPKRIVANYLMWRITAYSSLFMTEKLLKRKFKFTTVINGKQREAPRWKECVDLVGGSLSIASGALYVRKHFKTDSKQAALEMVNSIRKEFENILKQVTWMDEQTRQAALNKVQAMATHIGYPDELMDNSYIEKYYKNLEIDPDNYLQSMLNMNIFSMNKAFNLLGKPINNTDWATHANPSVVNAFYSSNENSIQFPAGILQGQMFSVDRPKYLNYGAIGSIIGHEITHGFDDQGSQFDLNGNLVDWWNADTKRQYLKKAKCIIEQYGNYTEPATGLKLNGINTQGENIADNGGTKESYLAYQRWARKNGPEPKLPGLDYTPQQMYWISAAQIWCSAYRTESMKMRIITGVHAPGKFRVIGPLSNMKDFANDFNCPIGSPMNPVHKCEVW